MSREVKLIFRGLRGVVSRRSLPKRRRRIAAAGLVTSADRAA
jgi:hypothetical protein